MREAKFNLEKRKDKKGNPITTNVGIRMSFFIEDGRLEYYTQCRVSNIDNFKNKGKTIVNANEPEAAMINKRLQDMKARVQLLYNNAISIEQIPTIKYLKTRLDEQFKGKVIPSNLKLVKDAFQEYKDSIKKEKAENTWKKVKTAESHFSDYLSKGYTKLTFEDLTDALADGFKDYLIGLGHLNNTVVKYTRSFISFLSWCKDKKRKYYAGDIQIEGSENEIDVIYLNKSEVDHLTNTVMPTMSLERVKDIFICGCYLGMRYEDLRNLKKVNVKEKYVTFYISKNKKTVSQKVPLVSQSRAILDKYKDLPGEFALPVLSNQKMNEYIKDIMKHAGFNEIVTIAEKQGNGVIINKEYERWMLFGCHNWRKSFISIAVEMGMKENVIKAITGHSKNSRAFTRYYEISEDVKQSAMDFVFDKPNKLVAV